MQLSGSDQGQRRAHCLPQAAGQGGQKPPARPHPSVSAGPGRRVPAAWPTHPGSRCAGCNRPRWPGTSRPGSSGTEQPWEWSARCTRCPRCRSCEGWPWAWVIQALVQGLGCPPCTPKLSQPHHPLFRARTRQPGPPGDRVVGLPPPGGGRVAPHGERSLGWGPGLRSTFKQVRDLCLLLRQAPHLLCHLCLVLGHGREWL